MVQAQQRLITATPTGLHLSGNVTPNAGTPNSKQGRIITQQDIRMMLGQGQLKNCYFEIIFTWFFLMLRN